MRKFLFWFITIIIILAGATIYWKYFFTYSDGYRAGLLQKFSHKGTFFKTYEGEIILSSVESSRNVVLASEKFHFSVQEPRVAKKLDSLQGYFVVIHYEEKNGTLPWRGDSRYMVDSVRVGR